MLVLLYLAIPEPPFVERAKDKAFTHFFYVYCAGIVSPKATKINHLSMRKLQLLLVATITLLMLTSCASIFTKKTQEVNFKGVPGTTIFDKNKNTLITEIGSNGFGVGKFSKQLKKKTIEARKDGYTTREYEMGTKIQPWFWGNIFFGGIPGMAIDAATGKMMKYSDKMIDVTLTPETNTLESFASIQYPEEMVSRENGGATTLEDTLIRWYFDSDPRGARIFYRVISTVPDEVKNTNESYLTTTPFEETKSFSIPGLTYTNSRNVTIEIKITKRGYEDQVKRYNVRQAIDQQEISGFFELVEK